MVRSTDDFETRVRKYAAAAPGILIAALRDIGVSPDVARRRLIGWDGEYVTIPIRDRRGRWCFFERWSAEALGVALREKTVELYPWDALEGPPQRLVVVEGIHEALVLESQGILAVTASGSGRFFKARDWGPAFREVPDLVLAYRQGDRYERRRFLPSRNDVRHEVEWAVPEARSLVWPEEVGADGGAYDFFVRLGGTVREFEALIPDVDEGEQGP